MLRRYSVATGQPCDLDDSRKLLARKTFALAIRRQQKKKQDLIGLFFVRNGVSSEEWSPDGPERGVHEAETNIVRADGRGTRLRIRDTSISGAPRSAKNRLRNDLRRSALPEARETKHLPKDYGSSRRIIKPG